MAEAKGAEETAQSLRALAEAGSRYLTGQESLQEY